jgi:hypothetical protein
MDGVKVDRLAQAFAKTTNRRQLAGLVGAFLSMLGQWVARGTQLGAATCRRKGRVCSLHSGCCRGLTCVTAATNTRYGICVPGTGRMVSIGTLSSASSEALVEDVTPQAQTSSAAPTTGRKADREAHMAEIRAGRDAKRTEKKTRLDTKRETQQIRKEEGQNRRLKTREAEEVALGPRLQLELIRTTEDDIETSEDTNVPVDTVKVTNLDDVDIVLTWIESRLASEDGSSLTTSSSKFTLSPGEPYQFVAGLKTADSTDARFAWAEVAACDDNPGTGAGYLVKAAFSINAENHDYVILCDGPRTIRFGDKPTEKSDHKRKRNHHRHKKKKR